MNHTAALALDNTRYLQQALTLIATLDDESYRRVQPPARQGSIGAHLRHNLDHYTSLFEGLGTFRVDYDARGRDPRVETDREYAQHQIRSLIHQLHGISERDINQPLLVKMDCGEDRFVWARSTIGRELQFLLSHTIHHYALIAILLRLHGFEPSEDFGVAPSTLRYQHTCVPQPG